MGFLTNNVERYSDTRPYRDLYMVVAVSLLITSFIGGHFDLRIDGVEGEIVRYWNRL